MALTREFRQTIVERIRRDPAFARALLDEAATLFLNGEPNTARLVLRDLVMRRWDSRRRLPRRRNPPRACTVCSRRAAIRPWTIWPPSSAWFAGTWE